MNREVEAIREKVHTTADAALFYAFRSEGKPFKGCESGCRCFITTFRLGIRRNAASDEPDL